MQVKLGEVYAEGEIKMEGRKGKAVENDKGNRFAGNAPLVYTCVIE